MKAGLLVLLAALTGVSAAEAATLTGDTIDISYYYPTRTHLYVDQGKFVVPASNIKPLNDPNGSGSIGPTTIRYVFGQYNHFTNAPFDGVVFTDLTHSLISGVSFDPGTNALNLKPADLTSTSNTISLNLADVTVQAGTVIQLDVAFKSTTTRTAIRAAVPPVPLPGSAPMLGAALAVLGLVGVSRRGRAAVGI